MSQSSNQSLFPLTSGQRGIWFDQMIHPDNPLYNIGGYLRIDGPVNRNIFEAAIQILIQQNDALRIVMRKGEDLPLQEFLPELTAPLEYLDLSNRMNPIEDLKEWMRHQINSPFHLYDHPLFLFSLIKISESCYYWFHKYHHLIMDAYAHSLLVQRLAKIYTAYIRGEPREEEAIYSYRDYLDEDLKYLESEKFSQDAQYWQNKYAELPAQLIGRKGFKDKIEHRRSALTLEREFYNRLVSFAAHYDASTFHLILTALYIYFTRVSGRDDFVIGLPILNRQTAQFKRTVGLFTGINPAWFRQGNELSSVELMRQIGRELRKDYRHQRIPLNDINRLAGLHKEGRVQIFDLVMTYQKQRYDVEFGGCPVEQVSLRHGAEQTPLALEVSEYNDQLDVRVNIDYHLTAFSEAEIEHFKERFVFLLDQILQNPKTATGDLEILPEQERQQVLFGFQENRKIYPRSKPLAQLFEEQVQQTPGAVALISGATRLTYQELNLRANQIAYYLRSRGAAPGSLTGVCLERSAELVIGILGILKAGGAYLPLDPHYPTERLAFMLQDSGVNIVVTQESLKTVLPESKEIQPIYLDKDWEVISVCPGNNRVVEVSPNSPAYVIYTSGSTGQPKGTLVSHYNVSRLFEATRHLYQFGPQDVWTLFHSVAFDFSVWEIFGALLCGGRLVVVPYWVSRSPDLFYALLHEQQVTVLNQTPSAFNQLIKAEESRPEPLPLFLRWIIFGGETLDPRNLKPWVDRHGDQKPRMMNMYGITETTVHVTYWPLSAADLQDSKSLIGSPLPDLWVYILDSRLRPIPIGIPGEMYVGGAGVALGYLNYSELSTQRFLADPFRQTPGARIYKTGDLARFLPDGEIEYLGRSDDQVKIRGFRVELEEIKATLQAHPEVQECLVIARADSQAAQAQAAQAQAAQAQAAQAQAAEPSGKQILAYIVPKPNATLSVTELCFFLQRKLPDYMIPAAFIELPTFPLTTNGKIDMRALPTAAGDRPVLAQEFVEPRHSVEKKIAEVWKEVLHVDKVGIHDNFFELGGHSLLMFRIRGKLEKLFGQSLSMADMFQSPTIHTLSQFLSHDNGETLAVPQAQERAKTRSARSAAQASRRQIRRQPRPLKTDE